MSKSITSIRRANAISNGVLLIALAVLFYTDQWWPGILLAIWATLSTRQLLTGRRYDFIISSVILISLFTVIFLRIDWTVLIPVLFVLGGIYIIFREYYFSDEENPERSIQEKDDDERKYH